MSQTPQRVGKDGEGPVKGGIYTFSGRFIHPLDPEPEQIHIEDIAHSLANQCRFTGHVREFYSTAQHSVLAATLVAEKWALWALLHDATEAYLADIASPIKRTAEFGDMYNAFEDKLMAAVCEAFSLDTSEGLMPPDVKHADRMMLWAEMRDLMPNDPPEGVEIYEKEVVPWTPKEAEQKFLESYLDLSLLYVGGAS